MHRVSSLRHKMTFDCRNNIDTLEQLWDADQRIRAIKLYIALNDCQIIEAKEYFQIRDRETAERSSNHG